MELERLIETEQRNEGLLRRAREEARVLVEAARTAAEARQSTLAGELEGAARRSQAELAAERERRTLEIHEAAQREVARYDAVPEDRVRTVAQALVDRLVAGDEP
jgi:vacuolar-type H+-ATPase subunit H